MSKHFILWKICLKNGSFKKIDGFSFFRIDENKTRKKVGLTQFCWPQERKMTSVPVKKALNALLKDPHNLVCADCKTQQHPRWASWSLGVFICIKCAGIHRSLGTHISKVKSVDLDTWKEENLVMLIKLKNNVTANNYYENLLNIENNNTNSDKLKNLLTDTNKLQNFIRNKYEYKKWVNKNTTLDNIIEATTTNGRVNVSKSDLLINDDNILPSKSNPLSKTDNNSNISLVSNTSSTPVSVISTTTGISTSTRDNSNNQTVANNGRSDLKKSILSLYSKPVSTTSAPTVSALNNNNSNNYYSGNNNNNFNNNMSNNILNTSISNQSNNSSNNNISTISLDDNDLFKNVWK